jgi:hypothetical protein
MIGWDCSSDYKHKAKYRIFIGKPVWRCLLGTSRRRLADNIKIDLRKIGC